MTNEVLGFLALFLCLSWSLAIYSLYIRYHTRKRKENPYDGDLHP